MWTVSPTYDRRMTAESETQVGRVRARVQVGHLSLDPLSEAEVVEQVGDALAEGRGGSICTPNLDIWVRTQTNVSAAELVDVSTLVVADGMPLVWSARLQGTPLPGRVTGSGLVEGLAAAAESRGWSVFLIGGGSDDTAVLASAALITRYPRLRVAGAVTPPFGFDSDEELRRGLVDEVARSGADLVFIGLGFPKQERLARELASRMPATWFLGCGAGVQMAAGTVARSPRWLQAVGGEWLFRLAQEPRRLARRYLVDDLPAVRALFGGAAGVRLRGQ